MKESAPRRAAGPFGLVNLQHLLKLQFHSNRHGITRRLNNHVVGRCTTQRTFTCFHALLLSLSGHNSMKSANFRRAQIENSGLLR